jgi:hypothetical protein
MLLYKNTGYCLLLLGPLWHAEWDGEGGVNTRSRRYMNTGNYVFVKNKRGFENSRFCANEVFANCIVTLQQKKKIMEKTPVSQTLLA